MCTFRIAVFVQVEFENIVKKFVRPRSMLELQTAVEKQFRLTRGTAIHIFCNDGHDDCIIEDIEDLEHVDEVRDKLFVHRVFERDRRDRAARFHTGDKRSRGQGGHSAAPHGRVGRKSLRSGTHRTGGDRCMSRPAAATRDVSHDEGNHARRSAAKHDDEGHRPRRSSEKSDDVNHQRHRPSSKNDVRRPPATDPQKHQRMRQTECDAPVSRGRSSNQTAVECAQTRLGRPKKGVRAQ